jgi:hypothetical protein
MGSLSFGKSHSDCHIIHSNVHYFLGISELAKRSVEGWFILLTQEEGQFYSVPVRNEEEIMEIHHRTVVYI